MSFTEQEKTSRAKGKRKQGLAGDRSHHCPCSSGQSVEVGPRPGPGRGGGVGREMTQRRLQEDPSLPVPAGESPRRRSHKEKVP